MIWWHIPVYIVGGLSALFFATVAVLYSIGKIIDWRQK